MYLTLLAPVFVASLWPAQDFSRLHLPPSEHHPRTREEWDAAQAALSAAGPGFHDNFPEWSTEFERMRSNIGAVHRRYRDSGAIIDAELAERLIVDELFQDFGHPHINTAHQEVIVLLIGDLVAKGDWLSESARKTLSVGLLRYAEQGGALGSPRAQADLATQLSQLSPDDPDVQAQVEYLLIDAHDWAFSIGSPMFQELVAGHCVRHFGDSFWLTHYERHVQDTLPSDRPAEYERAIRLLLNLLESGSARDLPRRLRDAIEASSVRLDQPALQDDLIARRLLVYKLLLSRSEPIEPAATDMIDRDLHRLLVDSRFGERGALREDRHSQAWGAAVAALKTGRVSPTLSDAIERVSAQKELPQPVRSAIHLAASALSESARERIASRFSGQE